MTTAPSLRIRVFIIHSHTVVRAGLALLLEQRPNLTVVGQASNCGEALAGASERKPHIILVELDPIAPDRLFELNRLVVACDRVRLIGLAGTDRHNAAVRAVRHGAVGLLRKDDPVEVMVKAIEKVANGEVWFNRRTIATILEDLLLDEEVLESVTSPAVASLTRREREVIERLSQGMRNKQIADCLFISEVTVRHHLTSIFGKLGVSSRGELLAFAYAHALAGERRGSPRLARSA